MEEKKRTEESWIKKGGTQPETEKLEIKESGATRKARNLSKKAEQKKTNLLENVQLRENTNTQERARKTGLKKHRSNKSREERKPFQCPDRGKGKQWREPQKQKAVNVGGSAIGGKKPQKKKDEKRESYEGKA